MGIGGITPRQKLRMAAWPYFSDSLKKRGLPGSRTYGSSVMAQNIILNVGNAENPTATALFVQGSDLRATDTLYAKVLGKAEIISSADTQTMRSSNTSSGFSAGVSVSLGSEGAGISVTASGQMSQGKASGDSWDNRFSHVGGSNLAVLDISGDLNVIGGVISGNRVDAIAGGNLRIITPQDVSNYSSQQSSFSAGVSIPVYGYASPSGSLSISSESSSSHTVSAGSEQSGIKAGYGGFSILVGKDTYLTGGVISSLADASLNRLVTRDIFARDLENQSSGSANSYGFSLSPDMFTQGKYGVFKGLSKNLLGISWDSGDDSGSTLSAVSPGTIILTGLNESAAKEKIASLNRDPENSNSPSKAVNLKSMMEQMQVRQQLTGGLFQEADIVLGATNQTLFSSEKKYYVAECPPGAECSDAKNRTYREATNEEVRTMKYRFSNGIYNTLFDAANNALGTAEGQTVGDQPILLVYHAPSTNMLGELLVAAYEKSPLFGPSNYSQQMAEALRLGGDDKVWLGHSNGGSILYNGMFEAGTDGNFRTNSQFNFYGAPININNISGIAAGITDLSNVKYFYNPNDTVAWLGNAPGANPYSLWKIAFLDGQQNPHYTGNVTRQIVFGPEGSVVLPWGPPTKPSWGQ